MTTNEPFASEPSEPFRPSDPAGAAHEPSWGTRPSTPPPGSGSDAGPSSAGPQAAPAAAFFDGIRRLGITRADPRQGRVIAGVAAGIARRYRLAPALVRLAAVGLTFFGGLGILLYGLGWLFLPHPDGRIHAQQVLTGTVTAGFFGALLTSLLVVHHLIPLAVIALVVWLIVRGRRSAQAPAC
ncbi:MAG TPA: PspC domain-containing protein [Kineosporiaceae bacterium]